MGTERIGRREVLEQGAPPRSGDRRGRVLLLAAGVALLLAAGLTRFAVYPQLARVPMQGFTLTSHAAGATVAGELSTAQERSVTLSRTVRVRPDLTRAADPGIGAFRRSVRTGGGYALAARTSRELVMLDRATAGARPCCRPRDRGVGGGSSPVSGARRGLVFAFPAGAGRDDYRWWDETLREAVPIRLAATDRIGGLPAAVYVRQTAPTLVSREQVAGQVVGSVADLVRADRVYSARERIWVNPASGVVLQDRRAVRIELRYEGRPVRTLLAATFAFDDATVTRNAERAGPRGRTLTLAGRWVPWGGAGLGLILLAVGATIHPRHPSRPRSEVRREDA